MTAGASTLLLEVGCEEIPDRMVEPAGRDLGQAVLDVLKDQHLLQVPSASDPFPGTIVATPRRLAAEIEGVLMEQPDQLVEIRGPAVQVAFGPGGKPTRAALGFAAGQEVKVEDLVRVSSDRGEVVMARRLVKGRRASEVLSELLPAAVLSLSFPKSMFWGKGRVSFVRPIRWV
ncbi:MAG: glycine--tRNA ligase subunit beta, partial [Acidobacteriota bacterium]